MGDAIPFVLVGAFLGIRLVKFLPEGGNSASSPPL